ncbi:MAG: MarR family winged helix-turn-helix transcriptional regulator [Clostridiales bacterium]|nr:MarR family winged helix-turn-helix transcriptional regulator [Clostridiales bacterium]MDY4036456.1 MarR family winged helix-turn-helix transcriptional regulator [Candidatus Pseudoscilispira sp.]
MAEKKRRSSTCHCIQLRRAASRVTERYDMALAPAGLTVGQYSLLAHLERLEPVSVSRLAEELELERTTLVRTLKPVLARQLVADAAEPGRRSRALTLTGEGRTLLEQARPLWRAAQEDVERRLGEGGIAALEALLERLEF